MWAVARIMSVMERVRRRTSGSQHSAHMRTAAAVIPSHGTIGKKKEWVKKLGDVSMRTLRNGSRSDLSMMGIRTPTQYLVSEFVTARKGGPGPMDRKENGSWFLGRGKNSPRNPRPSRRGGGGPPRGIRTSTSRGKGVRGPASCSPVFRYRRKVTLCSAE